MTVYSPQFSKFVKFVVENVKNVVKACKLLKSQSKMPWDSSKNFLINLLFLYMPDEGGENKIYQFLNFSDYFWKFWLRQRGLSFYGSQKGNEGADSDLMFQFCLPKLTGISTRSLLIPLQGIFWCMQSQTWQNVNLDVFADIQ